MAELDPPTARDIRARRTKHGLTQTQSAAMVHVGLRTWQQWEAGDHAMPLGLWELFLVKLVLMPAEGPA